MDKSDYGYSIPSNIPDAERQRLLSQNICELPLDIRGTLLENLLNRLYAELEQAGISLRPPTYLTDEWGCPDSTPVIGIPFYLADTKLRDLVSEATECPAETDVEIMGYLRHEAGHAFNYAYRLYKEPEWRRLFGKFSAPYREGYQTRPFSQQFVRHIPGWYAQKHADEDFAESFAVWLTPISQWREVYAGTPALLKLQYIDDAVRRYGRKPPLVAGGKLDRPLKDLGISLGRWCGLNGAAGREDVGLPDIIDEDLRRLFPDTEGNPAEIIFRTGRRELIRNVHDWTGINHEVLISLVNDLMRRSKTLMLRVNPGKANEREVGLAVFITTLAMNYQQTGEFAEE